jgi:protein-L-isoaspartate(D-aspartate) O-methyltransferase
MEDGAMHRALLALVGFGLAARAAQARAQGELDRARQAMVEEQIAGSGVRDTATLRAMRTVPRHEFVSADLRRSAYEDHPLPIGYGQTISQPYIVAYMTELLALGPRSRVLEIGTGSGYQAAILAGIAREVYTVEIIPQLASGAAERLRRLGYGRVHVRNADGFYGWKEAAPFDAIIVTAAAGFIPPPLIEQLKPGGRLVIPVGSVYGAQSLVLVEKALNRSITTRALLPVRFVPLVHPN